MSLKVFKVLKNVEISQESAVQVGAGSGAGGVSVKPSVAGTAQQARIVESNNEYAIIEVTCSCGGKAFVQCNYADVGGTGQQ